MGSASSVKAARRAEPKPSPPANRSRLIWGATAAIAVVIAIVVGVLVATRSTGTAPPPAARSPVDVGASAELVAAANAVGFHPTTAPGMGALESLPASEGLAPSNPNLLVVGAKAPAFTLKTPQGATVSLSDYRGKAVLLEFFATWCPHCNAEAPHLARLYRSLPQSRYAFVSVNADGEDAASVFAYHRYFGLAFPAVLDPSSQPGSFHQQGAAGPVTTEYQVQSYPTYYVIDPQGAIAWRGDGEQPDALLRQELASAAARG